MIFPARNANIVQNCHREVLHPVISAGMKYNPNIVFKQLQLLFNYIRMKVPSTRIVHIHTTILYIQQCSSVTCNNVTPSLVI